MNATAWGLVIIATSVGALAGCVQAWRNRSSAAILGTVCVVALLAFAVGFFLLS